MQAASRLLFANGWGSTQVIIIKKDVVNCDSAVAGFDTDIDVSGGKENGVLERKRDCKAEHWSRDEFPVEESSLNERNSLQGLFSGEGIIPEQKKLFAGIIFRRRNHP